MISNPFIANTSSEGSTKEALEAFINQLELQKKMTSMFAIRGLQEYIKQFMQFSMFQESLKEKIIELQNQLNPQISSLHHLSGSTSMNEQQDLMKASLEKMLEESFQQKYQSYNDVNTTNDSPKLTAETSNGIKDSSSKNLENRIRESILKEFTNKVSRSKQISKSEFSAFEPANLTNNSMIKPWKCDHEIHFSKGYCKECFNRIQNKKAASRKQSTEFVSIYQHLRDKVKSIVKRNNDSGPTTAQRAQSLKFQQENEVMKKTDVKIECLE